jgi:hypothetical protein
MLNFWCLYGFTILVSVWSRNTAAAIVATLVLWTVCAATNLAHDALGTLATQPAAGASVAAGGIVPRVLELGFWALPKPRDLSLILDRAIGAANSLEPPAAIGSEFRRESMAPVASVVSSLALSIVTIIAATRQLRRADLS